MKEQSPVVKAQPKTEEKKVEPLVTAEPSQAYGRNTEEDKPTQLTCDLAEKETTRDISRWHSVILGMRPK